MAWGLEKDREIERERRVDRKIKRESPRQTQTDSATIAQTHRQSYIQNVGCGKRGERGTELVILKKAHRNIVQTRKNRLQFRKGKRKKQSQKCFVVSST